jgi:hypothetical protein
LGNIRWVGAIRVQKPDQLPILPGKAGFPKLPRNPGSSGGGSPHALDITGDQSGLIFRAIVDDQETSSATRFF